MLLELTRLEVPPGQRLLLRDVTWQEFETILDELGDHRGARLAYDRGLCYFTSTGELVPTPEAAALEAEVAVAEAEIRADRLPCVTPLIPNPPYGLQGL